MMTGKSVKDIDRYQAVLTALLAREDNKFCADCKAKGPRWASWNLGIFVCIRCAGIHRNLGVHISRVKSVNLDQWTQEQIQCVQEMGNAKARRLYEAFLPECFQRPDSDQSVELFIRDKYDKKKYMDKVIDIQRLKKEKTGDIPKEPIVFEKMKPKRDESQQPKSSPKTQSQSVSDLLGLDAPPPSAAASNGRRVPEERPRASPALPHSYTSLGLFSPPPAPPPASAGAPPSSSSSFSSPSSSATAVSSSMPRGRAAASVPENLSLFLDPAPPRHEDGTKKLSKDSILSLYGSAPSVHANMAAAHAGRYVNSPQMGYTTSPYGPYHPLAAQGGGMGGAMMTSQMTLIGQQQNGMMGHPQNGIMGAQGGGGAAASAYMAGMPQSMLGAKQNSMMGAVGAAPQQAYGGQQAQQLQWNITKMTQHMAGMNFYGASGMMGYGAQHMGGPAAPGSAHVMGGAQHVWK